MNTRKAPRRGRDPVAPSSREAPDTTVPSGYWRADVRSTLMGLWSVLVFIVLMAWDYIKNIFTGEAGALSYADMARIIGRIIGRILSSSGGTRVLLLMLALVLFLGIFTPAFRWFFTRYHIAKGYVYRRSGALFVTRRQVRLESVQSIEISRPLRARLLGLAELRFEVADGNEQALHIRYLSASRARKLRAHLLKRVWGADPEPGAAELSLSVGATDDSAPDTRTVLRVSNARLAAAVILDILPEAVLFVLFIGLILAVTVVIVPPEHPYQVFISALFSVLGAIGYVWHRFDRLANFRLARTVGSADARRDYLRLNYGLTGTHAQTLFPARIAAVGIEQPLLWKLTGWYRVVVNVAGTDAHSDGSKEAFPQATVLPVGDAAAVRRVLELVLPQVSHRQVGSVMAVMDCVEDATGTEVVSTPPRAKILDPLTQHRNGYALLGAAGEEYTEHTGDAGSAYGDNMLALRGGFLVRFVHLVPVRQVITAQLRSGFAQRLLGLASVRFGTVRGPIILRAKHLPEQVAYRLATSVITGADGTRPYYTQS